jgi:hypothetical protein
MSQDFGFWHAKGYNKRGSWELICCSVYHLYKDIHQIRIIARDVRDLEDNLSTASLILWAALHSHKIIGQQKQEPTLIPPHLDSSFQRYFMDVTGGFTGFYIFEKFFNYHRLPAHVVAGSHPVSWFQLFGCIFPVPPTFQSMVKLQPYCTVVWLLGSWWYHYYMAFHLVDCHVRHLSLCRCCYKHGLSCQYGRIFQPKPISHRKQMSSAMVLVLVFTLLIWRHDDRKILVRVNFLLSAPKPKISSWRLRHVLNLESCGEQQTTSSTTRPRDISF